MILPGKVAVERGIILGLRNAKVQTQPCGVDLTVRAVRTWTTTGAVDFDNNLRSNAQTEQLKFSKPTSGDSHPSLRLAQGAYLIEFHENVDMPLDIMGQIYVRSSMFRSGALVTAGVMDSGYKGAIGAMLQVISPHGLILYENAKVAQMVFHEMSEKTDGYSGVYQGAQSIGL
ncbi:putative deoxyuridine 5'-triphosphate nucleotidohydrolase [Pseudocercospora fuligena]|uniref:Putative deoxyuridine 5'-triphosphate nucleotidohydrolase n=1 Tax=Pseudocercospora fuligena TaxID=685502 RepID=A0A8H6RBV5_9PEZI|nr:putative deoxyuridine 5'-triphosphate nucleotidohydrolase [Pseudocercospora fuligena]